MLRVREPLLNANPELVTQVRAMDGQVIEATLCIDQCGNVCAAALPADLQVSGNSLEGHSLASVLTDGAAGYAALREALETHGRVQASLTVGDTRLEAACVQLSQTQSATLVDELTRSVESVAHDLKSPLASVRGFVALLESQCGQGLGENGREYLTQVRTNVQRVQDMLEGLIEFTRARDTQLQRRHVHPFPVLELIAAEVKPRLDQLGIRLLLPADPAPVYADPRRFQQVALNLILNALTHMGEITDGRIEVEIEPGPGGHTLVVRDNGAGMARDVLVQIAELFRSGGCSRGSGLGLAIVRRVMESHGGSVEVDSAPGQGATFRAFFPSEA